MNDGQLLFDQCCEVIDIDGLLIGDGSVLKGFADWLEEYGMNNWTVLNEDRLHLTCENCGIDLFLSVFIRDFIVVINDAALDIGHSESFRSLTEDRFINWLRTTIGFVYYLRTK